MAGSIDGLHPRKAVGGRKLIVFFAEVPLADVSGLVSGGLEGFGDGGFLRRKVKSRGLGDPLGDADALGGFPSKEGGTGGRTDGIGGIGVGEADPGSGELVEIGGFVILRALAAEVGPAEIIDEEDDDIGFLALSWQNRKGEKRQRGGDGFHRADL